MAWRPNRSTTTVLSDFETGDLSNYNQGNAWTVTNATTLEGDNHGESTSSSGGLNFDGTPCSRGNDYRCQYIDASAGGDVWWCVGVQDQSSILSDCYAALLDVANGDIDLQKRSSTNGNSELAKTSVTLSTGTEYRISIEYGPTGTTDNLAAVVYDSNDSELARAEGTDDEHTGGGFGWYSGSNASDKVDYATERSL